MNAKPKPAVDPHQRALMSKVHIAKAELKLAEPDYRGLLERTTGKASAALCSEGELVRMIDAFKALGWAAKPRAAAPGAPPRPADSPVAKKARALWISLHQLGVVREPSEKALEAFARRQLGVAKLQWADQGQGFRLVEALKAMATRAGWDVGTDDVQAMKLRLVQAQWVKLGALGVIEGGGPPGYRGLSNWALRLSVTRCLKSVEAWTEAELTAASPLLGRWIATRSGPDVT